MKEFRPYIVWLTDEEYTLISALITLVATGVVPTQKRWQELAGSLQQRLKKIKPKKHEVK